MLYQTSNWECLFFCRFFLYVIRTVYINAKILRNTGAFPWISTIYKPADYYNIEFYMCAYWLDYLQWPITIKLTCWNDWKCYENTNNTNIPSMDILYHFKRSLSIWNTNRLDNSYWRNMKTQETLKITWPSHMIRLLQSWWILRLSHISYYGD